MIKGLIIFLSVFTTNLYSSVNPQMINLNMQFKSNNQFVKSELAMPFYQKAELEKTIDKKNILVEVSPKRGKNSDEVEIEMKFFRPNAKKAFAKKEIVAKINQESKISVKGVTVKVTPVL